MKKEIVRIGWATHEPGNRTKVGKRLDHARMREGVVSRRLDGDDPLPLGPTDGHRRVVGASGRFPIDGVPNTRHEHSSWRVEGWAPAPPLPICSRLYDR